MIGVDQARLGVIQEILNEMVDTSYVAGVNCMVLEKGKEMAYYEAGYADLGQKRKMTRNTICCLYSMSKPITAAATMLLMERGKLDLLDPVEKYIASFKGQKVAKGGRLIEADRPVTIKDLLSMTSGITYGSLDNRTGMETDALFEEVKKHLMDEKAYTTKQVAECIGKIPLAFQPGAHWNYGASADVLGAVIEVVAGQSFGEFLEDNFFEPLDMKDTGFNVPEEKKSRLSKVYEETGEGLKEYNGNNLGILVSMQKKAAFESGGAGLVSTIEDYSHFTQMLLNGGKFQGKCILAPKTVEFMTTCHLNSALDADVATWESLVGHSYGNLMRVLKDPGLAVINGTKGEYGWDGWLGPYFSNDPIHQVTVLMMQQKTDTGTTLYSRRIRNVVSAAL